VRSSAITAAPAAATGYAALVHHDGIHGSLYNDPEVFRDELARIWDRSWLYIGHESEIPTAGDYALKPFGAREVILSRDRDGEVHVLFNRCSHRGNRVCEEPHGSAKAFRCPYHGWTFSAGGRLLGYPYNTGYGPAKLDKESMALGRPGAIDSYRGLVFARFARDGPSLVEHLGHAAEAIDRLCDLSPEGEIELTAGWLKHRVQANWKILVENETDGYHPHFVHGTVLHGVESYTERSSAVVRDLGGGHTELDPAPDLRRAGQPLAWINSSPARMPQYVQALQQARGDERAAELLIDGPPHVMLFPNLFIAEYFFAVITPQAVDRTVQHQTPVLFKGADELNQRILRQLEGSIGPAGMILADDAEMYERSHEGLTSPAPEWIVLRRGLEREHEEPAGTVASHCTDETAQRAIWRHWLRLMTADGD